MYMIQNVDIYWILEGMSIYANKGLLDGDIETSIFFNL